MKYLILFSVLTLVGCTTTGSVSNIREKILLISFGDTKEKVLEVLGTPGDRSFRGNSEAWQYCSTGFTIDTYSTIWFDDGLVTGVTTKYARLAVDDYCSQQFLEVDWGQRPYDQKIDIN